MKSVLKAKPQSTVVDADNSIYLNASDAMILVVQMREAGKQEVRTGSKPVEHITQNIEEVSEVCFRFPPFKNELHEDCSHCTINKTT